MVRKKLFPGYLFIQMDLGDEEEPNEAWEVVRGTPGITGFVGAGMRPVPLSPDEVRHILEVSGLLGKKEAPKAQVAFREGTRSGLSPAPSPTSRAP